MTFRFLFWLICCVMVVKTTAHTYSLTEPNAVVVLTSYRDSTTEGEIKMDDMGGTEAPANSTEPSEESEARMQDASDQAVGHLSNVTESSMLGEERIQDILELNDTDASTLHEEQIQIIAMSEDSNVVDYNVTNFPGERISEIVGTANVTSNVTETPALEEMRMKESESHYAKNPVNATVSPVNVTDSTFSVEFRIHEMMGSSEDISLANHENEIVNMTEELPLDEERMRQSDVYQIVDTTHVTSAYENTSDATTLKNVTGSTVLNENHIQDMVDVLTALFNDTHASMLLEDRMDDQNINEAVNEGRILNVTDVQQFEDRMLDMIDSTSFTNTTFAPYLNADERIHESLETSNTTRSPLDSPHAVHINTSAPGEARIHGIDRDILAITDFLKEDSVTSTAAPEPLNSTDGVVIADFDLPYERSDYQSLNSVDSATTGGSETTSEVQQEILGYEGDVTPEFSNGFYETDHDIDWDVVEEPSRKLELGIPQRIADSENLDVDVSATTSPWTVTIGPEQDITPIMSEIERGLAHTVTFSNQVGHTVHLPHTSIANSTSNESVSHIDQADEIRVDLPPAKDINISSLTNATDFGNGSYGYIAGRAMSRQSSDGEVAPTNDSCHVDPYPCQHNDACRIVGDKIACYRNHCSNVTCSGRGLCIEEMYKYRCVCPPGYVGKNCERLTRRQSEEPCEPNPCKGDCVCRESCKHELGYYCASRGGFTGKNCTIPVPRVVCGEQNIVVNISKELYEEFDHGVGNTFFYVAPNAASRSTQCEAAHVGDGYQISISLPFRDCGSRMQRSGSSLIVSNRVIADRRSDYFNMETPVIDFQCIYESQYRLVTSLKPVAMEPMKRTGYGQFTPVVELCKLSTCPSICPSKYSVADGAVYTVGELIYFSIKVLPTNGFKNYVTVIHGMTLTCDGNEVSSTSTEEIKLVEDGCPADGGLFMTASTGRVACASLQTPRSPCSTFFIHLHLILCPDEELVLCDSGEKLKCASGRFARSVSKFDNKVDAKIGPIIVIDGTVGIDEIELYPEASNTTFNVTYRSEGGGHSPIEHEDKFVLHNVLIPCISVIVFLVILVSVYSKRNGRIVSSHEHMNGHGFGKLVPPSQ